jgi:hypothetical protein
MKLFLLIVLILMALYFLFSIFNYGKEKKTGGPKQKFWLVRALVALAVAIAASLGLYHLKQKEKKENGTN